MKMILFFILLINFLLSIIHFRLPLVPTHGLILFLQKNDIHFSFVKKEAIKTPKFIHPRLSPRLHLLPPVVEVTKDSMALEVVLEAMEVLDMVVFTTS